MTLGSPNSPHTGGLYAVQNAPHAAEFFTRRVNAFGRLLIIVMATIVIGSLVGAAAAQDGVRQGSSETSEAKTSKDVKTDSDLFLVVLGIAQDAGYPQAGCQKSCCEAVKKDPSLKRFVTSLAVVDAKNKQRFIFDCSPDFREQLSLLDEIAVPEKFPGLTGIFLTHAHIGHYTGLMHLGHEAMGCKSVPVYAMPRMESFLKTNGPWSQLVKLKNIKLEQLSDQKTVKLNERISVTPFLVPHRDEFSETVGFRISTASKTIAYLPDIDKWSKWDQSIEELIKSVDLAFLDGSFFANGEIPGRDMSIIPHPFVSESINRFASLDLEHRKRVRFIHLNHTNPALQAGSAATRQIEKAGMRVAVQGEVVDLR